MRLRTRIDLRVGSTRVGSTQLGSTRVGSTQLGSTQVGSTQVGSTQVGSTQVGSARRQLGSTRIGSVGLLVLALSVLLGGSLATDAQAQSRGAQQRARQLYGEAQALFDSGQYAPAERQFRAAYEAVPNPVVLKAIAAAQERQGNIAQSIATLQRYLAAAPTGADRAEVEGRIRDLSSRPATVAITSIPPGALILVDGQNTGQTTPAEIRMPAGEHTIEFRLEGYSPAAQTFEALAATRVRLEMPLTEGAGGDVHGGQGGDGLGADGTSDTGSGSSADPSIGVWVTAGIGALGLVSGTVFGFLALSEQSNFDAMPTNDTADRGEAFALAADISFGVAAAMAITAIVLYIVERSGGSDSQTASNDPEQLRLDVAPFADSQGGGVAAQLRF